MNGAVFRPVGTLSVYHALGLPGGVLPSSIPVAGAMAANATTLVPIQQHPVWMHTSTLRGPLMAMGPRVSSDPAEGNRNDKAVKASALAVAGTLAMGAEGCHAGGEQDVALQVMVWGSIAMLAAFGAVVVPAVLRAARGRLQAGRDYGSLLEIQKQVSRWEQMSSQEQCEQVRQWLEIVNGDQGVEVRCAAKEALLQVADMSNTDHDAIAQECMEYVRAGGKIASSMVEVLSDHLGDETRLRLLLLAHPTIHEQLSGRQWGEETIRQVLDVPEEELKRYNAWDMLTLFKDHADAFPAAAKQVVVDEIKTISPRMRDYWMAAHLAPEDRSVFLDRMIRQYGLNRTYPYELVPREDREVLRAVIEQYGHELKGETLEEIAELLHDMVLRSSQAQIKQPQQEKQVRLILTSSFEALGRELRNMVVQDQEGVNEALDLMAMLLPKLSPQLRERFAAALNRSIESSKEAHQKEGERLQQEKEAVEANIAEQKRKSHAASDAFEKLKALI